MEEREMEVEPEVEVETTRRKNTKSNRHFDTDVQVVAHCKVDEAEHTHTRQTSHWYTRTLPQ